MSFPRLLLQAVYLAGRPWTVWVVAIAMIAVARAQGASGFDAVVVAIGPALLWAGVSWLCRALTRYLGNPFARSILPSNRPLPKPHLAVIVTPDQISDTGLPAENMVERLPENLRRLIR